MCHRGRVKVNGEAGCECDRGWTSESKPMRGVIVHNMCNVRRSTVPKPVLHTSAPDNSVVMVPSALVLISRCIVYSVVTIPDFTMRYASRYLGHDAICIAILGSRCDMYHDTWVTMRYVSRYFGHDAICIAILVYRINRCLDLQFVYNGN